MKIKVCGLKYKDNVTAVAALQPDYMGFIFYRRSPRCVEGLDDALLSNIPAATITTAVLVNEEPEVIEKLIKRYHFKAIQLHGNETPDLCGDLKGSAIVIKAFGVDKAFDFSQLEAYKNSVDYFLFDTKTDVHGGSGNTFDWRILDKYDLNIPFFLSGGLSPENIEKVLEIDHPQFYGVDLNSRFEISPGLKDIDKLQTAFTSIKQTI